MSLTKKFLQYLYPSVLAMIIFSLNTMIDGLFVRYGVSEHAFASITIAVPYINVLFGFSLLISSGSATVVSIFLGEKNLAKANQCFMTGLYAVIVVAIVLSAFSLTNLKALSTFLGAGPVYFQYVNDYLFYCILFSVFVMLSYFFEVLTRADGFPKLAMLGVSIATISNIMLDYLFVMVGKFGIKGAAIATGLAQMISTFFMAYHFFTEHSKLKISIERPDFSFLKRIIPIGIADSITEFSVGIVIFLFNRRIITYVGEEAVITYSIIAYLNTLVMMTMLGTAQAMQPLQSYHLGQNDCTSIRILLQLAMKTVCFASIVWFLICQLFAKQIGELIIDSSHVKLLNDSVVAIRLYSYAFLIIGYNIIFSAYFSAIEKPWLGMMISLSRGFLVISLALMILPYLYGAFGIWISAGFSELLTLLLAVFLYRKEKAKIFVKP